MASEINLKKKQLKLKDGIFMTKNLPFKGQCVI